MADLIVVTGATGHIGGGLVDRLLERGVEVRAVARGADKLQAAQRRGAEVRAGSLGDEAFLTDAFRGARAVFAMVPPAYQAPDQRAHQRATGDTIARALQAAGVGQVVSLSSVGAELPEGTGPIKGLYDFEKRLEAVPGLSAVHLRPASFMENHLASIGLIKGMGINGSSMKADLTQAMIATRDISAAAAEVLAAGPITGRSVRYLLGPRDYTQAEATRILGEAIGRPDLKYVEFPSGEMRQALTSAGFSANAADMFVEMQQAFNAGRIRPEPRSASNTTPTTLEQFARDTFAPAFDA